MIVSQMLAFELTVVGVSQLACLIGIVAGSIATVALSVAKIRRVGWKIFLMDVFEPFAFPLVLLILFALPIVMAVLESSWHGFPPILTFFFLGVLVAGVIANPPWIRQ